MIRIPMASALHLGARIACSILPCFTDAPLANALMVDSGCMTELHEWKLPKPSRKTFDLLNSINGMQV
jgi:hypothetical protein